MIERKDVISEVGAIYEWIDGQMAAVRRGCRVCGDCCDFEAYGHRLYVSTPEIMYFAHSMGPEIRPMPSGVCPYRVDNRCTAYPCRFSGCRIFDCRGEAAVQGRLSEAMLRRFKDLCAARNVPYRYLYVKDALDLLAEGNLDLG